MTHNNRTEGRHAGTAKPLPWGHWAAITALAVLLTFLGAFFLGSITPANAATRVNWNARTCSAYATWQHHKTTANLDATVADSFHVAWKYLGEDASDLYRAVRAGKNTDTAVQYFTEDCTSL